MFERMRPLLALLAILLLPPELAACTLWSAHGPAFVEGGGTLIVKNRDWVADHRQVLKTVVPERGFRYFGIHAEGNDRPGLKAGINEQGLVVVSSTAASLPRADRDEQGRTGRLLARLLSGSRDVEEALQNRGLFFGPRNIMLADRKRIAVVEIGLHGEHAVTVVQNGWLAQTNHYSDRKLLRFNRLAVSSSRVRRERIEELLRGRPAPFRLDDFDRFSRDQNDGPDHSIFRTGSAPGKQVTLSVWMAYLPERGEPQLAVRILNPGEPERSFRPGPGALF